MVLVPRDSPIRRVPSTVDRQAVLFLDGVRYSLQIFDLASRRLARTLDAIAKLPEKADELGDLILEATCDAWTMVDSIHRLRELVEQIPRMKKNQPELQLFLRQTNQVEELRHFFQHFRTEIHTFTEQGMPLWGTLSWPTRNPETGILEDHIIVPGSYFRGEIVKGSVFDFDEGRFVERVVLQAGPERTDLVDLLEHVERFTSWYVGWFEGTISDDEHRLGADAHFKFILKPVTSECNGPSEVSEKDPGR